MRVRMHYQAYIGLCQSLIATSFESFEAAPNALCLEKTHQIWRAIDMVQLSIIFGMHNLRTLENDEYVN